MPSCATYNNNPGNGGAGGGGGYNSAASNTYSSTANQLYSQTSLSTTATVYNNSVSSSMPHTMSALSNGPPHNANMHPQQSNMHPNQHIQQPGQPPQHQAGMMNGPSSVNVMNSNVNRPLPNNAANPPRPSQPMVLLLLYQISLFIFFVMFFVDESKMTINYDCSAPFYFRQCPMDQSLITKPTQMDLRRCSMHHSRISSQRTLLLL